MRGLSNLALIVGFPMNGVILQYYDFETLIIVNMAMNFGSMIIELIMLKPLRENKIEFLYSTFYKNFLGGLFSTKVIKFLPGLFLKAFIQAFTFSIAIQYIQAAVY